MLYRLYAYIYTGIVYPKLKIGFWMLSRGASIRRGNDAFPPVSDSPWDSRWISSSLLLLTLTAYAATATTICVSYGSSLALSLPLLLLLLSTPLSHLGLITAPHSTLASLLCVWAASSALSALPRAS